MSKTTSIAFPKMFNVVENKVAVLTDEISLVNRSRLLILTEPTEIYNEPEQGVGLKRYLWHYNNDNQRAIIQDRIIEQLRDHEPQCNADGTQFANTTLFTGTDEDITHKYNKFEMTIGLETKFSSKIAELTIGSE